jgi:hypothetical protein
MWQPVWFSKIYMYKSKPIFTTNSHSCESLRSVLTPVFMWKSADQFSLWEPSRKPSEHSRTAPNTGPADHAKDVQHLYESQAPGHHRVSCTNRIEFQDSMLVGSQQVFKNWPL